MFVPISPINLWSRNTNDPDQWMTEQKQNLIITKIIQQNKPTIIQVTEAGILGKIGFNSAGVGTLFNAIRVHGADATRLPAHFGLRMALESTSVADAVSRLESYGMASKRAEKIARAGEQVYAIGTIAARGEGAAVVVA